MFRKAVYGYVGWNSKGGEEVRGEGRGVERLKGGKVKKLKVEGLKHRTSNIERPTSNGKAHGIRRKAQGKR